MGSDHHGGSGGRYREGRPHIRRGRQGRHLLHAGHHGAHLRRRQRPESLQPRTDDRKHRPRGHGHQSDARTKQHSGGRRLRSAAQQLSRLPAGNRSGQPGQVRESLGEENRSRERYHEGHGFESRRRPDPGDANQRGEHAALGSRSKALRARLEEPRSPRRDRHLHDRHGGTGRRGATGNRLGRDRRCMREHGAESSTVARRGAPGR